MSEPAAPTIVGRYVLHAPIARGGMATIHLARLLGAEGFSRMVAAKRLHPEFTEDAELVEMLLDEARIASKIHHPNVVPVLDVVRSGGEVILVQEYVHGVPLDKLLRAASQTKEPLPASMVVAVAADMLAGLGAAHGAKDELGASLGIIHRDISPQNVLVGVDGIARLLDFGVAKASLNAHVTRAGVFKGKIAYTSPEQLRSAPITAATDLYAAAVVIWEALATRRLHPGLREAELVAAVSAGKVAKLTEAVTRDGVTSERWAVLEQIEPVLEKAMAFAPEDRWASAAEMRDALLAAVPAATAAEVSRSVKLLGKEYLEGRERLIVAEESSWRQRGSGLPPGTEEPSTKSAPASAVGTLRPSEVLTPAPPVPERGRAQWAIAGALAVIGLLLTGILLMLVRRPDATPPASAAAPPAASIAPVASTSEIAAAPTNEPTAAPTASAKASASPSAAANTVPAAAARAPARAVPAAPRPTAAAAAPAAADCNPPFYFDGKKKIFKPGCL
ncbi:serine/threonine protein kinase [Minicystis rosea]|nr:serine/threonine protein kinase [Minicystis rosea]